VISQIHILSCSVFDGHICILLFFWRPVAKNIRVVRPATPSYKQNQYFRMRRTRLFLSEKIWARPLLAATSASPFSRHSVDPQNIKEYIEERRCGGLLTQREEKRCARCGAPIHKAHNRYTPFCCVCPVPLISHQH
jgi:hypothetical protein